MHHPNFILLLLFWLAFANYDKVFGKEDEGKPSKVLNNLHEHLAPAKNGAVAVIKNDDLPKLTEIHGKDALQKANDKNAKELGEFKTDIKEFKYSATNVGMSDTRIFGQWLAKDRPDRVKSFIDVFEYLVGLDHVPICVANQFLKSIDPNNLIIGEIGQKVPVVGSDGTDRTAFMFSSQRSVRQLNIDEEGIECKESLKEPTNVAKLLQAIIVGLEKEETEGASERKIKKESEEKENGVKGCFGFVTALCQPSRNRKKDNEWDTKMEKLTCSIKVRYVFNHLKDVFIADKHQFDAVVKIVEKKINKWDTIGNKLERIGHQFKGYSLFLLAPANFQYFLSAILSIAKLSFAITLAVDSVRAFGLDDMLTKEAHDICSIRVCDGVACGLALWLFNVNGVIPLYLRGYAVDDGKAAGSNHNDQAQEVKSAETHYYDQNGKKYSFEEVAKWQHSKEDDVKFIQTIVSELAQHRGHPFEDFMLGTVEKLKSLGDKEKWHERAEKFKKGWAEFTEKWATFKQQVKEIDPKKVLTSLENAVEDITLFLITPRHIAFALKLILSIFGLYTPVYISLEVLQLLGITDVLIEIMKVSAQTVEEVNDFRQNGKPEAVMNFVFNENGLVPMLLTMGTEQKTKERQMRVAKELEMFGLIKTAILKHNGDSFRELYKFFVDQIKENPIGLMIVQTFQKEQPSARARQLWAKLREAHMTPRFKLKWNLVFIQEKAIKHICDLREMSERVEEFDKKISNSIAKKTNMQDVYNLKMERGDCDAFTAAAAAKAKDDKKVHPMEKHEDIVKKP